MSEETKIQCPACTAELPPETIECPWCGHVMTPNAEETPSEENPDRIRDWFEPELAPVPSEPATIPQPTEPAQPSVPTEPAQPILTEAAVFPVPEPGLTEFSPVPAREPARSLKVMGIILTVFSFLALGYFIFQVLKGTLPQLVLLLPIFGMIIGLISVAVAQKR